MKKKTWTAASPDDGGRPEVRPDPCAAGDLTFRDLPHGLWVHRDVPDSLTRLTNLRNRVGIVLHHLAAHGRTTVVKGCRDAENRGWRRSPLGGGGGMQYYLWWVPQGSGPARDVEFPIPANGILVRATRHHDDHTPLAVGVLSDYDSFSPTEIEDKIGSPWTDTQLEFVIHEDPVRLVHGRPGSGKTTVLWKAVEARSGQHTLYLTWSRELATVAGKHFRAFAPADAHVDAHDFSTFLGEVCGADAVRRSLGESRTAFSKAIGRLSPPQLGPWAGRAAALHAEVRAILLGRAVPGDPDSVPIGPIGSLFRLSDTAYRDRRADKKNGVGRAAATALLKIIGHIDPAALDRIFPELAAAATGIERLKNDKLPQAFAALDRVVVDEAQDLTLLETAVVVELCRAIARRQGHAPWLLMAGDDGQTVRPSGFHWGRLSDLLNERIAPPQDFHLEDNLRCPSRIADVIERASKWYTRLPKEERPTQQGAQRGSHHADAQLLHVVVSEAPEAVALLKRLDDVEGVVVVAIGDRVPAWAPDELREMVLTPSAAKGLEYQSVCVLDPGALLGGLARVSTPEASEALRQQEHRTAIDQLRVALSRATEALAFLDVGETETAVNQSAELLGDAARYSPDDLIEHFAYDATPEERVLARTKDARALIDDNPGRAWQRACQAARLLGDPDLPNGVADKAVRAEARSTLLATAARLLVDGLPSGVRRPEVIDMCEATDASEPDRLALGELEVWTRDIDEPPFGLLDAAIALKSEGDWLRPALNPRLQRLRKAVVETFAEEPDVAGAYEGDVEGWLKLTRYADDAAKVAEKARALRCQAVDVLTRAGETEQAEQVLAVVEPPDLQRLGRLREKQGRSVEAAETFAKAGMPADALRNWRDAGGWEHAAPLATGEARADLEWLVEFDDVIRRRPAGHHRRLTKGERERLGTFLECVKTGRAAPALPSSPPPPPSTPRVILPNPGPDLPPGFTEIDEAPPVPEKSGTGRFFGRPERDFQHWTLASNAFGWRLTDERLVLLWQAEYPNSPSRYTVEDVRRARERFNRGPEQGKLAW